MEPFDFLADEEKQAIGATVCVGMEIQTSVLIVLLKNDKSYSFSDMASVLFARGTHEHTQMTNRLRSFLSYRNVRPDGQSRRLRGRPINTWMGSTVKDCLPPDQYYQAELCLALIRIVYRIREQRIAEEAAIKTKRSLLLPRITFKRVLAAVFVLLAAAVPAVVVPDVYDTLRNDGVDAAARRLIDRSFGPDPLKVIQSIWIDFREEDYIAAEDKVRHLLSQPLDEDIRTDCFYLLAQINAHTGYYYEANEYYEIAMPRYREEGDTIGIFLCLLGQAKIHFFNEFYDGAEATLAKARALISPEFSPEDIEYYYQLMTLVHIGRERYNQALDLAYKRIKICGHANNVDTLLNAYIDISLILLLLNRLDEAAEYMVSADLLITETGVIDRHYHNLANWLLWQRKTGLKPDTAMIVLIERRLFELRDAWLSYHNELAMTTPVGNVTQYAAMNVPPGKLMKE